MSSSEKSGRTWMSFARWPGVDDDGEVDLMHFDLLNELRRVCWDDGEDAVREAFVELSEHVGKDMLAGGGACTDA